MSRLVNEHCQACHSGTPGVEGEELARLHGELSPDWREAVAAADAGPPAGRAGR
ncbi:MAG: hypothetical protein ABSH07_12340 [Candidatus Dormibacteria bacterium]|jgi:hypothetical protein